MAEHKIITIGRQFGSGGHEIGNMLSTRLDIPMYDNNLVRMAAEKLDIREETARAVDETTLNSFLTGYVIAPMEYRDSIRADEYTQPLNEQVYELQSEIIRKLSKRGPCVIVGRCAGNVWMYLSVRIWRTESEGLQTGMTCLRRRLRIRLRG